MNITDFVAENSYWAAVTAHRLVMVTEEHDRANLGDWELTLVQARELAHQLDDGQSVLTPDNARQLAISLIRAAVDAESLARLPENEMNVFERLHVSDGHSCAYHDSDSPGLVRLGLIALHDLGAATGLSEPIVVATLDALLDRGLIEEAVKDDSPCRYVRLCGIR